MRFKKGNIIGINTRFKKGHIPSEEMKKKICESRKGGIISEETRLKLSRALKGRISPMKGRIHSEDTKNKMRIAHKGKIFSEETKKKMSVAKKGKIPSRETINKILKARSWYKHSEEIKKRIAETSRGRCPTEASRRKRSEYWINYIKEHPDYIKQLIRRAQQRPNKSERILIDLFKQIKLQYKYVGDGSVIFGRKNPDFINCNGQKKIIEIFGDRWHNPNFCPYHQTEEGTKEHYAQYGYDTLVIWNSELKKEFPIAIKKIIDFDKNKYEEVPKMENNQINRNKQEGGEKR